MKPLRLVALGAFVGVALLLWLEHRNEAIQSQEIASLEAWEKEARGRLRHALARRDSTRATATNLRARYRGLRTDTLYLPGKPDTVCVPVSTIALADSTIAADSTAAADADTVTAIAVPLADSADRRADLEKKRARGPFLRPAVELLFEGRTPRLAGVLEAGPQRLSAVARLEVDSLPRFAFGVRYRF